MSLTSPLGLMRHVKRPNLRLETLPWLNVILVIGMMSFLSSSYIYAPGLAIALNSSAEPMPKTLQLPEAQANADGTPAARQPGHLFDTTLTIQPGTGQKMNFYMENVWGALDTDYLAKALNQARSRIHHPKPVVLLLKFSDDVPSKTFTQVSQLATAAGYDTVVVATKPEAASADASAKTP